MAESSDDASALELELDESSITVALAATSEPEKLSVISDNWLDVMVGALVFCSFLDLLLLFFLDLLEPSDVAPLLVMYSTATSIFTSGLYPPLIGIPGTNGLVVCSPFLYASTLVVLYPLGSRMMKNGRSVSGFPALFAAASALLEK